MTDKQYLHRLVTTVIVVVLVILILAAIWKAPLVFLLGFAAVIWGTFLGGLADWVSDHTPLDRGTALLVVVLSLFLLAGLAGLWMAPTLIEQAAELEHNLPVAIEKTKGMLRQTAWGQGLLELIPRPATLTEGNEHLLAQISGYLTGAFGVIADTSIVVLVGLFLAIDPDGYRRGIIRLVPLDRRARASEVLISVGNSLRGWLVVQAISMVVCWFGVTAGLLLIRQPLAVVLGVITAILAFIPNLGIILALVPGILAGLLVSPTQALLVILVYLVVQVIIANVLMPFVIQKQMNLPPAMVIGAQVLMGTVAGLLGVLLATPMLAAAVALIKHLYIEDVLGDRAASRAAGEGNP